MNNQNRRVSDVRHNCKVKFYPDGKVHLTCFTRDIYTADGWCVIDDDTVETERSTYNTDCPRDDNMRRAKGKIFDIALSNQWSYMITLTLDGAKVDRYNAKDIVKPFTKWLNNMVSRKGLKYLIVPELHADGAIHFHGLINDVLDLSDSGTVKCFDRKKPIKRDTALRYGYDLSSSNVRVVYNINNYRLGWSTAVHIDSNVEAVSKYMTKYTCKNFQKIFGQSFFSGGGVSRDLPSVLVDMPYTRFETKEYRLPESLGGVKYAMFDSQASFDNFIKSVGGVVFG